MLYICIGGPSNERAVSLGGGQYIHELLTQMELSHQMVTIDEDLSISIGDSGAKETLLAFLSHASQEKAVLYPLLHGAFGEDGIFVGICESLGVKLLSSSSTALALMMDKDEAKEALDAAGLCTPQGVKMSGEEILSMGDEFFEALVFPLIIKPNTEGSSQGLALLDDRSGVLAHVERFAKDQEYLLEERIVGREFSVGVVEYQGSVQALPPTEVILTDTKLFDEHAKYTPNACLEITPAEVDPALQAMLQDAALRAHKACNARYISRSDMILTSEGEVVVLEVNAIPGMTRTSFLPAQLSAVGLSVADVFRDWMSAP